MAAGNTPADSGDRIEPGRVGIAQHQLIDLDRIAQPRNAIDQLGRVCAASTDDCDLHSAIMALRGLCALDKLAVLVETDSTG